MRCEFTDKQYPKITAVSAPSKPGCFGAAFPLDLAAAVLSVSVLSLHAFRVPAALGPLIVCLADRAYYRSSYRFEQNESLAQPLVTCVDRGVRVRSRINVL